MPWDGQTEQAHLEELKGRRNFGRERLLAIFWSLLDAHLLQQEDGADGFTTAAAPVASREQQSAAVLGHLAGLVAVRMLLQVGLLWSANLRCRIRPLQSGCITSICLPSSLICGVK